MSKESNFDKFLKATTKENDSIMKLNEKNENIIDFLLSIQTFEYNNNTIRSMYIDGEIWFVAGDICNILGLTHITESLKRVNNDDCSETAVVDSKERFNPKTKIVNESGLYDLIFQSIKEEAKSFRRWITKEVLPSIRKTGKYELSDMPKLSDDEMRVLTRKAMKEHQKDLHNTLDKQAGMQSRTNDYAIWHAQGYQGLYELESPIHATKQIAHMKGIHLKTGTNILDFMSAEELGINIYHITQAEAMLKQKKHSKNEANELTFNLGKSIVDEIKKRGNRPPILIPAVDNIKDTEKKLKLIEKHKAIYSCDGCIYEISHLNKIIIEFKQKSVNNIWIIALFLAYFKDKGTITTTELLEFIPKYYNFSDKDKSLSSSTHKPKYIQKIKNIISNRDKKTNPIYNNYFEYNENHNILKITNNGITFLKKEFF